MKTYNQLALILLLSSSLSLAQEGSSTHINKSYIKAGAKHKSKKGDKNSTYVQIKGNKEFKKALKEGKLNQNYSGNGAKDIYIDIKDVHLSKQDLKDIEELKIGSTITGSGKVGQVVNIKQSRFKSNQHIHLGANISAYRGGDISVVTNIENSQIGGDK